MGSRAVAAALALGLSGVTVAGQELEPRAYSPSPVGTTFVVASATRSAGSVLTDPTLPLDNVEAKLGVVVLGAGHTFPIAGRQALFVGAIPIAWLRASGDVGGDARSASRRGLADPRFKLSVNLRGSPAMTPAEFVRTPHRSTIVGASVAVVPPLGQYDGTKLINLGANRWSFKPEVGVSKPIGRWLIDGYAGVWLFTANDSFYTGDAQRTQDPILTLQTHVSYMLTRRAWAAVDGTWYTGGRTNINGVDKFDLQRSSRIGATISLPIKTSQSVKFSYSAGATTRIGGDFQTIGVSWQMVFFWKREGSMNRVSRVSFVCLALALSASAASAQSADELAKQTQNPVASLISVPFQGNWDFGIGETEATGTTLNIQPVAPFGLTKNWNAILRVIMPLQSQPTDTGTRITGMGDTTMTVFVSPAKTGKVIWGAGPALLIPTATNNALGTEKFGIGPSIVALVQPGKWTTGALWNQIWSVDGANDRADVNQMFLQPFANYNLPEGLAVGTQMEISTNWDADSEKTNAFLFFSISKVTLLGHRPVSFLAAAGPAVVHPDGRPDWRLRFAATFLFPRK